ncbi:uncharacterized protein LOC105701873 [Orussus abietinus]|uniref:uncharacterized protein LOC105701873 n=1 Tax=Orussus abietinus TaxID=222816 RepID=UPI0006259D34|nr:uncharacterized protein LOC105701873 [Orussus abietinus]
MVMALEPLKGQDTMVMDNSSRERVAESFTTQESSVVKIPAVNVLLEFLSATNTICFNNNGNFSVTVPKSWSASEYSTEKERCLLLSHVVMPMESTEFIPVLKKSVMLDTNGHIYYYVYGRRVNIDQTRLPQMLSEATWLSSILLKFEYMCTCEGLGTENVPFIVQNVAYKDSLNNWHHNQCRLLSKNGRCDLCKRLRKTVLQKQAQFKKSEKSSRISSASNPADQKKLNAMKSKLNRERRLKNCAKLRLQYLTDSLKGKQDEIAAIQDESLEEKCLSLDISETQKIAMKEIIAAAKKDVKGRRYSEDWIMLCLLLNVRSPTYYEFLRNNNVIPLPCAKTIRSYLSAVDKECTFDETFSSQLLGQHSIVEDSV